MKKLFILNFVLVIFLITYMQANDGGPVTVSPAEKTGFAIVQQSCPTFSWTYVPRATGYTIVVFKMDNSNGISNYLDMKLMSDLVLVKEITGSALSWTPSVDNGLINGGEYIWFVQAVDLNGNGIWSKGAKFRIEEKIRFVGFEEKLKEILKEYGVSEADIDRIFNEVESDMKEIIIRAGDQKPYKNSPQGGAFLPTGNENDGNENVYYGYNAGLYLSGGNSNAFFGYNAGWHTTTGFKNAFFGNDAGRWNNIGSNNSFFGEDSGHYCTTGTENTFIGRSSGTASTTGLHNTYLGAYSGSTNINGKANVFLGYCAGFYETGSNRLYIENSYIEDVNTPLIYGQFDTDTISINGKLGVSETGNYFPTYEVDVDGYVRTKYFMQQSAAPQMRWYETDASDPGDFFKMNYHANSLEFIWYDDSTDTTYVPIKMVGTGYVGINNQNPTHMLDVGTSGAYCNGGAWVSGSSLEYKENIQILELTEARDVLAKLNPVKYNYKEDKEEQYLGFIAEDVPELVAMKDRKGLHTMDVVTVLTKVVQNQQEKIKKQNKKIKILEEKHKKSISDLLKRIERMEKSKY